LLATASAAVLLPTPLRALGASRPQLHLFFPQDPLATWFLPTYGQVKADGRRHLGIDLMAPKLSPVYAIGEGEITRANQSYRAGRYIIIEHHSGWESWYLHLNNDDPDRDNGRADWSLTLAPGVEEGSIVSAGQHIGFVGDSGNAEWVHSHTHFELHLGTRTVNPFPYLVESHIAALGTAAEHKAQLLCYPGVGLPAVDGFVCPSHLDELPHLDRGLAEAF
jgi:murein DD-endopeptidase MepM/ murein hydrolase activator NlpD